ncbi:hypothetical protein FPQ18DRAFT_417989 [Pyronema domesticum]|nr:hypothetical protein FPQ18DRAFT_417989 [Pyronema domesticum]
MWRGTWMRTAKYDIDQVYSMMGAFEVTLDTSLYSNKYDAMIALRRAILAKGGRANWLTESLASGATWTVSDLPRGLVDDAGAVVFTAPTMISKIILGDDTTLKTKRRKSRWQSRKDRTTTSTYFKGKTGSLAIFVGKAMDFNLPGCDEHVDTDRISPANDIEGSPAF